MDVKKFLSAGLAGGLVIVMISYIADIIVQTTYPYDVMSFGGMRAPEDPLMLLFFLHYWVISFAMAYVWTHLNLFFPGDLAMQGRRYGFLMWCVASVPSTFIVYTSMDYPLGFTLSSLLGSFVYMIAAGFVIVRFMEE